MAHTLKVIERDLQHVSGLRLLAHYPGLNFAVTYSTMLMGYTVFASLATLFLSRSRVLRHAVLFSSSIVQDEGVTA